MSNDIIKIIGKTPIQYPKENGDIVFSDNRILMQNNIAVSNMDNPFEEKFVFMVYFLYMNKKGIEKSFVFLEDENDKNIAHLDINNSYVSVVEFDFSKIPSDMDSFLFKVMSTCIYNKIYFSVKNETNRCGYEFVYTKPQLSKTLGSFAKNSTGWHFYPCQKL